MSWKNVFIVKVISGAVTNKHGSYRHTFQDICWKTHWCLRPLFPIFPNKTAFGNNFILRVFQDSRSIQARSRVDESTPPPHTLLPISALLFLRIYIFYSSEFLKITLAPLIYHLPPTLIWQPSCWRIYSLKWVSTDAWCKCLLIYLLPLTHMFKYILIRHPSTMENCKIFTMCETPCAYRQRQKVTFCVYDTGLLLTDNDKRRHLTIWLFLGFPDFTKGIRIIHYRLLP